MASSCSAVTPAAPVVETYKETTTPLDFYHRGRLILAPMVRAGTLPLRLLALEYGADVVYSEEQVDFKFVGVNRVVNDKLGTIDFVHPKQPYPVFRTCEGEQGHNCMQIGTSDAQRALKAASIVARDVASIDINMGCPKHFSLQAGMGAALLQTPEVAVDILKTLRRNLTIPVSCKIRLLDTTAKTIEYARAMESAGAVAIGVHVRETHERRKDKGHWDQLPHVVSAVNIPVIANGDVFTPEDVTAVIQQTGVSGAMLARGALRNASVFKLKTPMMEIVDVMRDYVTYACDIENRFANTKYTLLQMLRGRKKLRGKVVEGITRSKTYEAMLAALSMEDYKRPSLDVARHCKRPKPLGAPTLRSRCGLPPEGDMDAVGSGGGAGGGAGAGAAVTAAAPVAKAETEAATATPAALPSNGAANVAATQPASRVRPRADEEGDSKESSTLQPAIKKARAPS